MASPPQRRRAARHQQPLADDTATRRGPSAGRKRPITVDAIIETALGLVEAEGYAALAMRRVATALNTGPASLYAHVVNKDDLDDLLIGRLCAEIDLPEPDPRAWRDQVTAVCARIRDQYLRYPGISQAALAVVPTNAETLRVNEGMLAIVLAGGVEPQTAAWAVDALSLYVSAFCLETSLKDRQAGQEGWADSRDEPLDRFAFPLNLIVGGLGAAD